MRGQLAITYDLSLASRLANLRPGASIVYYRGFLEDANPRIATTALNAYFGGKVHLLQRRLGPPLRNGRVDWKDGVGRGFEYIAVGR